MTPKLLNEKQLRRMKTEAKSMYDERDFGNALEAASDDVLRLLHERARLVRMVNRAAKGLRVIRRLSADPAAREEAQIALLEVKVEEVK